jgi:hypothetical protein
MGKVIKKGERPDFYAKGGDGHMFGKGSSGPARSGESGKASNDLGKGKWANGGSTKMFGKGHAGKKAPGVSGKESQEG